jgi:hypothetical protein
MQTLPRRWIMTEPLVDSSGTETDDTVYTDCLLQYSNGPFLIMPRYLMVQTGFTVWRQTDEDLEIETPAADNKYVI